MRPTSQAVSLSDRPLSPAIADLVVRIADTEDEFEQIHRLNYQTFVEEVGQHQATADGRLVDAHHGQNVYFIAKRGPTVVGMICLTPFDGIAFSIEKRLADPRVIDAYRAQAIEIRLLAVRKETRSTAVFARLASALAEYAIARGYRYGLISGLTTREPLYRRFGFERLGEPVPAGLAAFVPMVVSLERFRAYARQHPALVQEDRTAVRPGADLILLTPGPVSVHPAVLAALGQASALHHRSARFGDLVADIEGRLRALFAVPDSYAIALIGTSGTGAVEAMVRLATSLPRARTLVLTNGHFGDRLALIADSVGVDHDVYRFAPAEPLDPAVVAHRLDADPRIGSVLAVHMETSVGQFNRLQDLEPVCRARGVHLCTDMVSSLGGERFDFRDVAPSAAVSVSGKALAAFPGIAIAFVRHDLLEATTNGRRSHYLDIARHVRGWVDHRSVPFTLPVTLFPPLHEALLQIEREGLARKIDRHERTLAMLETWLVECGFTPVPVCSPSRTTRTFTYRPEQEAAFDRLVRRAQAAGFVWYQNPHYHRPARQFQVSTMGWIDAEAVEALVEIAGRRRR
jgi:aspartate aminotransferase-like enzyme/predicted N-acetyltransferase YhbS